MYKLNEFYGKIWIYVAQASGFGLLSGCLLIMGPLALLGGSADGGIPMIIAGLGFSVPVLLAVLNILARRTPIIQVFDQGLEVSIIGASAIDGLPLAI